MPVSEIKNISFFCALVRTATLCVCHHFGNTGQFFNIGDIVTGRYYAFFININDIISHHLAAPYLSQRSKHVANELYKVR